MKNTRIILPALTALLALTTAACDDDSFVEPEVASLSASASALDFGALDLNLGAGLAQTVTVTNTGSVPVAIGPVRVAGSAADDYTLLDGGGAPTLNGDESLELALTFDPSAAGSRSATLEIVTDRGEIGTLTVQLSGMGETVQFRQVDRVGIPALNTVFNHPPQFSKTDYNTASPRDDLASYTGLFETVLGAVANPDPAATAALLLPDELPVSLGAPTTRFAELTGRAPADDAVDVALSVVVGIESLKSDNVDANDRAFSMDFPYLAAPN